MSINEHYKAVECYETKYNLWKYNKDIQAADEITNWKKYVRPFNIFTKYL